MNARMELVEARRLLSGSPHGGNADGDVNLNSTTNFKDLVSLAQTYVPNGNIWSQGDFDYDGSAVFADLISLAQNYNSAPNGSVSPASAAVSRKGKLTIAMGTFDNAVITATGRSTHVLLTHVSRHGEIWSADVLDKTLQNVRSIDLTGSAYDDSITLGDGVRFSTVHAGVGADTITGDSGDSALYGGDGDDVIYGGGGSDSIFGEAGDDRLNGQGGDDLLDGGVGKDRLDGGSGRNKLIGGKGTDSLTVRSKDKIDHDEHDRLKELA